jgi:hypothetical protein
LLVLDKLLDVARTGKINHTDVIRSMLLQLTFALYTGCSFSPEIKSGALPTELYTPAFVEDLLCLFCMFDTDGYHPGLSPDINDYSSVVLCCLD